jgi:penicillin amidase
MLRIQTDIHPLDDEWMAKQVLRAGTEHPPEGADSQYALSLLRNWDGEAHRDSAATLVCEVTRRALLTRILKPKLGDDLSGYHWPMNTVFLQDILSNQRARWLPPGDSDFKITLLRSLEEGVRQIRKSVGTTERAAWQWGKTVPLTFRHPLSAGFPLLGSLLDVGPFAQDGTQTTVKQTTATLGPSMRMVVDLSNFDGSVENITLGESGQVFSQYYRDQFNAWYDGTSFPMLFSDQAVEKRTIHRLVLRPPR